VCALLIVLAGLAVIPTLPIAQFPNLAPPQVGVTSVYIGASAQTVESAVTIPLEQQINGAEGMKYMTSTSGNDGTSQILVTFDLTRNPDLATVDIQNRVNTASGRLPAAVKAVGITTAKTAQNFVFGAAVISDDDKYSTLFMSNYLDVYVRDALKRIPGVADVMIFGERKFSMRLWLDPVRMAGRALTASDVVSALSEQNVEVAAGQVGQQPAVPGQNYQVSVRAVGRLSEPAQFENIILKTNNDGTLVRLKDVGRAELGAESYSSDMQFNGRDAVGIAVIQLSTARCGPARHCGTGALSEKFPPRHALPGRLRYDRRGGRVDSRCDLYGGFGDCAGHPGDLHLSRGLENHDDSLHRHSGFADRHVRIREITGLLDQHPDAVWNYAGDGTGG
jgi:hydrophobic/amphiphilic exporter-1 (mainly G- bacteria), HAE1 family